jgi:DNA-binding transcriptional ArsR family regulator
VVDTPTQVVLRAIQSPTKLNIVMLLAENETMTVTQMSKFTKVTRANLYRAVSEMVSEGLLLKPEVRVKGNYVEKFYRLNETMFGSMDSAEQRRSLDTLSSEDSVTMLRSIFEALSVQYRILAEQVKSADAEDRARIANFVKKGHGIFTYSALDDSQYKHFLGELMKINERISGQSAKNKQRGENTVIITAFPQFKARKKT